MDRTLALLGANIDKATLRSETSITLLSIWLKVECCIMLLAVIKLLCGKKVGPLMLVALTTFMIFFEANPFASYTFEMDRTESLRRT